MPGYSINTQCSFNISHERNSALSENQQFIFPFLNILSHSLHLQNCLEIFPNRLYFCYELRLIQVSKLCYDFFHGCVIILLYRKVSLMWSEKYNLQEGPRNHGRLFEIAILEVYLSKAFFGVNFQDKNQKQLPRDFR